jgi:hypothetical protein
MGDGSGGGLDETELARLHALRRAAAEIFGSTVIQTGGAVGVSFSARIGEEVSVSRRGHDVERFRSFMIGLRRTYAQSDGAHFLSALNTLAKRFESRRPDLAQLRTSYLAVLTSQEVQLFGMNHSEVFESWLYGSVFHDDDPNLRKKWNAVAGNQLTRAIATMLVESTAVALAHHVLALDRMIAEVLGEDPLPQLDAGREPSSDSEPAVAFVRVSVRPNRQHGTYLIDFTNVEEGEARNIAVERFTALNGGQESVLLHGEIERKFPYPKLRRGESVSLIAAPTHGSPSEFEVVVSWDDPGGTRRQEDFRIDLFTA